MYILYCFTQKLFTTPPTALAGRGRARYWVLPGFLRILLTRFMNPARFLKSPRPVRVYDAIYRTQGRARPRPNHPFAGHKSYLRTIEFVEAPSYRAVAAGKSFKGSFKALPRANRGKIHHVNCVR